MKHALFILAAMQLAPQAALHAAETKPARPNIVLILTDDQGYGDLSCHGNPVLKTPALDKLHAEAIRLTDFHVAPMCTPTRGQLMTGRHALANGAYCVCSGRTFLRRDMPTMAELFAASGYRTGLFGKWHLGDNYPHRPNDRGFQEAVYHLGWGITSTPDSWNGDYFDDHFRHNGRIEQYRGYCTDVFFDEARKWMRERAARREPFLLYLRPTRRTGRSTAPSKYKQPYQHLDADTAGFFGMIANLDENLAKLDATLTEAGLRENTILIFMTDNGGTGGIKVFNAGLRGAKASLYEGGHRVPCFIRWPGGRTAARRRRARTGRCPRRAADAARLVRRGQAGGRAIRRRQPGPAAARRGPAGTCSADAGRAIRRAGPERPEGLGFGGDVAALAASWRQGTVRHPGRPGAEERPRRAATRRGGEAAQRITNSGGRASSRPWASSAPSASARTARTPCALRAWTGSPRS